MKGLAAAAALLMAPGIWAATYTYTGGNYYSVTNYTTCGTGTCANFTTSMRITGSFTTSAPLAANLSLQNVAAQVTSYSFSDGVTTFANSDSNTRLYQILVDTDGSGRVTWASVLLELWRTGTSPHAAGNRLDFLFSDGSDDFGHVNVPCLTTGSSPAGVADSCTSYLADASSSTAMGFTGSWATPSAVPTLSGWGSVLLLAALLGSAGWVMARRRPA